MSVEKPRMMPSRRSRSTRRLTAGADSATCPPMSWNERRASSRSSAMICRSISSTEPPRPIPQATYRHCAVRAAQRTCSQGTSRERGADRMATTQTSAAPHGTRDFMPLHGIDHVELWVGNAKQAAYFFTRAYGFTEVAYAGLETGVRDRTSHVLQQGRVRLVLTGTLQSGTDIADHHAHHGDGVKVIALSVPDVDHAYREATTRGATGLAEPHTISDDSGEVRIADIAAYGDTIHRFVHRAGYEGAFLPGYKPVEHTAPGEPML